MSAGSKTEPGGYTQSDEALEQFEVNDARSPAQVAAMIRARGFDPVWKDWDAVLGNSRSNFAAGRLRSSHPWLAVA